MITNMFVGMSNQEALYIEKPYKLAWSFHVKAL
jgi:hypothetical protein